MAPPHGLAAGVEVGLFRLIAAVVVAHGHDGGVIRDGDGLPVQVQVSALDRLAVPVVFGAAP